MGNTLRKEAGLTVVELLVVVAIIAVLAAILFPVFAQAKSSAKATMCLSNLRQLGTAWQLYAGDADDTSSPSFYYSDDYLTEYAWDFVTDQSAVANAEPGLVAAYARTGAINQCPIFRGESWGRPYTGYAYNTTYLGIQPLTRIADPSGTVAFADAGFGNPVRAHNFLRAPSDALFSAGKVHFRHFGGANILWVDSHATRAKTIYRATPTQPQLGALSDDDTAYDLD